MNATEAHIEQRFPVWDALSEFFLDTELRQHNYQRIARALAASPFTVNQIEEILINEVCPVCRANMLCVAGEWAGFNSDWLKAELTPRIGKTIKLKTLFKLRHRWMYNRHWDKVRKLIADFRSK